MILARSLAIIMGGILMLLAPSFATDILSELRGESVQPSVSVMATVTGGVAAMVSGFFFAGVAGHRMGRRPWMRVVTGVLLVFPFVGTGAALLYSEHPLIVWIAGPALCFTCLAFAAFVFPGMHKRSRRPMRPRNYADSDVSASEFVSTQR